MIIAAFQVTAVLAALGLVVLWLAAMVAVFQDAFAPQPMLAGRFSSRLIYPDGGGPVVSLAERVQARLDSRTASPWRAAA